MLLTAVLVFSSIASFTCGKSVSAEILVSDPAVHPNIDNNSAADVTADGNIELEAVSKDSSFRIHVALHGLEDPYREIFELRVFGELSFQQIGTIFGKTENWARVTYHRARLKLQERMSDQ